MKAIIQQSYGSPDVLSLAQVESPTIGPREILVRVHATPITRGDRRLRAADYPGVTWLAGRLMSGLLRPRHAIPGTNFAGTVVAVGDSVTRFAAGDMVYGTCAHGACAEFLPVRDDGPVVRMPDGISFEEAAALPYGAVTALTFLRDLGEVRRGQRVLVVGAAGGVGRFAVQIARHFGAEVIGMCRTDDFELVRDLGASEVIDSSSHDFDADARDYDIIFDTSGTVRFAQCRASLTRTGRFLSVDIRLRLLWHMALTARRDGRRALFGLAMASRQDLEQLRDMVEQGSVRPVIDRCYPLEQVRDAHLRADVDRPRGSVVLTVGADEPGGERVMQPGPGLVRLTA